MVFFKEHPVRECRLSVCLYMNAGRRHKGEAVGCPQSWDHSCGVAKEK